MKPNKHMNMKKQNKNSQIKHITNIWKKNQKNKKQTNNVKRTSISCCVRLSSCIIRTCNLHKGKRGNTNHKKGENTISNTTSKSKAKIIIWHLVKRMKSAHELITSNISKTKTRTTWNTKHDEQHYCEKSLGNAMNSPQPFNVFISFANNIMSS
jgi:hypothetical protein